MTPIRVLVFGYGFAGAWIHDPLIRSVPGLEISGVVTTSPRRQHLARTRHPGVEIYETPDEALARSDASLAVVATPNRYHVELSMAALDRGMAVVVDKPLAPNARDARSITEEAERLGQTLAVFHNRRWDGDFLTLTKLHEEGRLGEIYRLTSRFDRWLPDPSPGWRDEESATGGGLLLDLGSHLVDQAIRLLGPVESVFCQLATLQPGRVSEDTVFIALEHRSGSVSHLHAGALEGRPDERFHVSGSEGAYVKHGKDVQEARLLAGELAVPGETGRESEDLWGRIHRGTESEAVETIPGDWSEFYRRLLEHLEHGAPNPVGGEEASEVIGILDVARASAANHVVISTPSRDEQPATAD